jgi:hypothetical protein
MELLQQLASHLKNARRDDDECTVAQHSTTHATASPPRLQAFVRKKKSVNTDQRPDIDVRQAHVLAAI